MQRKGEPYCETTFQALLYNLVTTHGPRDLLLEADRREVTRAMMMRMTDVIAKLQTKRTEHEKSIDRGSGNPLA